jgi:hypothetical protein
MERVTVEFFLEEKQVARLRSLAAVWGLERWEDCFRAVMSIGSRNLVDVRLDLMENAEPFHVKQKEDETDEN